MNARKENIKILNDEVQALKDFCNEIDDLCYYFNLTLDIIKLQEYISSYTADENFCWKNSRKEDEAIQAVCKEIREIIGLGNEDEDNLCSSFDDLTEMHEALGYHGDINRVEAILLGAYDGFDVRELVGDRYCALSL